ncbi:MAG: hypothetical protein LBF59_01990 [Prevotellaceae bacterium]|nr:hypothetical protein [Prevotellaceae bacterium]
MGDTWRRVGDAWRHEETCGDAWETQNIASLQIDAIDDHSVVRRRDAIFCVSIASPLRLHCVSLRLINDVFDDVLDVHIITV